MGGGCEGVCCGGGVIVGGWLCGRWWLTVERWLWGGGCVGGSFGEGSCGGVVVGDCGGVVVGGWLCGR